MEEEIDELTMRDLLYQHGDIPAIMTNLTPPALGVSLGISNVVRLAHGRTTI